MKLIVENFGPIKKGEIDLSKKFYVFVGYNNTGKTYMSQLLWGIFNYETIEKFAKSDSTKDFNFLFTKSDIDNKLYILEIDEQILNEILKKFSFFIKNELIKQIFNLSQENNFLEALNINFSFDLDEIRARDFSGSYESDNNETIFHADKPKGNLNLLFSENPNTSENDNKEFVNQMCTKLIINLLLNYFHLPIFLPANRNFYPSFYKYLFKVEQEFKNKILDEFRKSVENGEKIDLEGFNKLYEPYRNSYTKPIRALFSKLFDLNFSETGEQNYYDLVDELSQIIGGDIINKQSEGLGITEFFLNLKKQNIDLPMYLSSSSTNQLTLLHLFLKYWATEKYNFLFIDEPEENLHPSNQIKLTNLLLKFATRNNNRVLITTHSPLIAENINNYLYLSLLRKQNPNDFERIMEENKLNIDLDIDISQEEVGIYFFKDGKITDLVQESTDWGINFRDFYRVEQEIANIGKVLTDYLYVNEQQA